MPKRRMITLDGNEATASVAHRTNEVIAIYPITPSSNMGEWADEWAAQGKKNIWGVVPQVSEMQSEAGAAGAVHGALQAGALTTTFTASQGLLLMIPNMYKIAGELTSYCMHVVGAHRGHPRAVDLRRPLRRDGLPPDRLRPCSAPARCRRRTTSRSSARPPRSRARVPFLHFFDGFRTSHEVAKIEELTDDDLRAMITDELVAAHRGRALTPDHPVLRGTAQNPDVFFQAREACNPYYDACPGIVAEDDGRVRQAHRPPVPPVRLLRRTRRRARDRHHGLGRRHRPRVRRVGARARREDRRPQGPPLPPVRHRRRSSRRCPRP